MLWLILSTLLNSAHGQDCSSSPLPVENSGNKGIKDLAPRYLEAAEVCKGSDGNWVTDKVSPKTFQPYFKGSSVDCDNEFKNAESFINTLFLISKDEDRNYENTKNNLSEVPNSIKLLQQEYKIPNSAYSDLRKQHSQAEIKVSSLKKEKVSSGATESNSEQLRIAQEAVLSLEGRINKLTTLMRQIEQKVEQEKGPTARLVSKGKKVSKEIGPVLIELLRNPRICYTQYQEKTKPIPCSSVGQLKAPTYSCGERNVSKGFQSVLKILKTVESRSDCASKASVIKASIENFKSNDLDDLAIMNHIARNIDELIKNPIQLRLLGATLQAAEPVMKKGSEDVAPSFSIKNDTYLINSAIQMRMAMIGELKKAQNMVLAQGETYKSNLCKLDETKNNDLAAINSVLDIVKANDNLCNEGQSTAQKVLDTASARLEAVLSSPQEVSQKAKEFSQYCDHKVARIFGGENAVASVCGHDHVKPGAGGSSKETELAAQQGQSRAHVFVNMHIYPNKEGSTEGEQTYYAPAGATSASRGGSWATTGSYNLKYNQLGKYRGVTLNINHLGKENGQAAVGKNSKNLRKNDTVPVGIMGGTGGEGKGYTHSHVQLFDQSGGRVNFVDAFCRD